MIFRLRHCMTMSKLGGAILLLILVSLLFFSTINTIQAENIDLNKKYTSTDTVTLFNSYDFKLKTSEKVEYKIDVVGDGYVNIFLATENDPDFSSN